MILATIKRDESMDPRAGDCHSGFSFWSALQPITRYLCERCGATWEVNEWERQGAPPKFARGREAA